MAGIQLEQLDIKSISKYFATIAQLQNIGGGGSGSNPGGTLPDPGTNPGTPGPTPNPGGNCGIENSGEIINILLSQIDTLISRINKIEKNINNETQETKREKIIQTLNTILTNFCKKFNIVGNNTKKSYTFNHDMGTTDIQVAVINNLNHELVFPTVVIDNENSFTINFNSNVGNNISYTVITVAKKQLRTMYSELDEVVNNLCTKHTIEADGTSTDFIIAHNKNTKDVYITCVEEVTASTGATSMMPTITLLDSKRFKVHFNTAPKVKSKYHFHVTTSGELLNVDGDYMIESLINEDLVAAEYNVNKNLKNLVTGYDVIINNNETTVNINHNLKDEHPMLACYDINTNEYTIYPTFTVVDKNNIKMAVTPKDEVRNFRVIVLTNKSIVYHTLPPVTNPVTRIKFKKKLETISGHGTTISLKPDLVPETATVSSLIWRSSNPSVAIVRAGKVTARQKGSTIITAESNETGATASIMVVVKEAIVDISSIVLNKAYLNFRNLNQIQQLTAKVLPEDTNFSEYKWESSKESVAIVDQAGKVTSKGIGDCIIKAVSTKNSNIFAECMVNVKQVTVPVSEIIVDDDTLEITSPAGTLELGCTVEPWDASNAEVTYSSNHPEYAMVDENSGKVTAKSNGVAIITITAKDGSGVKKDVTVVVSGQ